MVVKDIFTKRDYLSGDTENKYEVISAKVCNKGKTATPVPLTPTGYFYVEFKFPSGISQHGSSWDDQGNLIGSDYSVQSGECFEARAALSSGLQLATGSYKVKVIADSHGVPEYNDLIAETKENNNSRSESLFLRFN